MSAPVLDRADIAARVAAELARAEQAGERPPGRRAIAARLGVSQHAVRQVLDTRAPTPPAPAHPGVQAGADRVLTGWPASDPQDPPTPPTPREHSAGEAGEPAGDQPQPAVPPARAPGTSEPSAPAPPAPVWTGDPGVKMPPAWPLVVIAIAAAVVIWGGWVELGAITGFGPVRPLPGIADRFVINTAIALPVGVEAYGGYALRVWHAGARLSTRTRSFARASALGALVTGAGAQIAAHAMKVSQVQAAPLWLTGLVASVPVLAFGLCSVLHSMVRRDADTQDRKATEG